MSRPEPPPGFVLDPPLGSPPSPKLPKPPAGFVVDPTPAQQLQTSAAVASSKTPEREAEILGLSKRTGLPASVVERNYDTIKKRAEVADTDYSKMLRETPNLAAYLAEPSNAAVSKDDHPSLMSMEHMIGFAKNSVKALGAGALNLNAGIWGALQGPTEVLSEYIGKPGFGDADPFAKLAERFSGYAGQQEALARRIEPNLDESTGFVERNLLSGVESLGQNLLLMAGALPFGPAGEAAVLGTMGAATGGQSYRQARGQGVTPTRALLFAGEQAATEILTEKLPVGTLFEGIKDKTGFFKLLLKELPQELAGENLATVGQDLAEWVTLPENKDKTFMDYLRARPTAAAATTIATIVGTLGQVGITRAVDRAFLPSLSKAVQESKTFERMPDKVREFIAANTKDTPVEDVYIPVEDLKQFFQDQKVNPNEFMENLTAEGSARYQQSLVTGEDVRVPLADYATKVLGDTERANLFKDAVRLGSPDSMNERERKEFAKEGAATPPVETADSSAQIREDIIGQMVNTGYDRTAVEAYASLYESVFKTLGERSGQDPLELYQQYGLNITRPIPEVLQHAGAVDQFDVLLDRLRSGDVPQQREIFGPSLLDFIREKGGVQDTGGELKSLDVDADRKAFTKAIIQKKGLPLDTAREFAVESGYLPKESSVPDFLNLIEKEARGTPVFAQQNADSAKLQQLTLFQQLESYLKASGIDLKTKSNEEVKAILNQAAISPETGHVLAQGSGALRSLTGNELGSFAGLDRGDRPRMAELKKAALALYSEWQHGHGRTIDTVAAFPVEFTGGGKTELHGGFDPIRLKLIPAIPEILQKGTYLGRKINHDRQRKPGHIAYHYFEGIVSLEGQDYVAKVSVWEDADGKKFYDLSEAPWTTPGSKAGAAGPPEEGQGGRPKKGPGPETLGQSISPESADLNLDATALNSEKRGQIRFGASRQFTIELLEHADLSTFLHESGHFFLEVFGDAVDELLTRPGDLTPEQQKMVSDYGVLLKELGVQDRSMIGTEQHEQFARLFEAYAREGKAPSAELRNVFARFRAWLLSIYQSLKQLRVNLTPEVRGVMDRLLASDEQIEAAKAQAGIEAIFTDAQQAGMSEKEFAAYRSTVQAASDKAKDTLQRRLMEEYNRERETWWTAQREIVRDQVAAEVQAQRDYIALAYLQKGTLPDGSALPEGTPVAKLSKQTLVEQYGKDFLKRLPRPYIYARKGGISQDVAAQLFGYSSGDELVQALVNLRPMDALIEAETDSRMKDRYGDMLLDGSIADKAKAAVMGEGRSEILRAEMKALAKKQKEVRPFLAVQEAQAREGRATVASVPTVAVVRAWAEARVQGMRVRDLRPQTYWTAARQAGQKAFEALGKGDYDSALLEKRKELLNVELYRATVNARGGVDVILEYLKTFDEPRKRGRIGLAGESYLDQIDALLDRYEFKRISQKAADRRDSLNDWIAQQQAQGLPIDLPASIQNEAKRQNYQTLSVEQLQGLADSVKMIEHLARLKNKLLKAKDKRELDAAVAEMTASIGDNAKKPPNRKLEVRLPQDQGARRVAVWFASHRKMASLLREMDGFIDGGKMWERIMLPINDAANAEATQNAEATRALAEIFDSAFAGRESTLYKKQFIPEIHDSLSKMARIMVALNWGNDGNRQRVMSGYQWTDGQVQAILNTLEAKDWQFVQSTWDYINTFWPEIAAKEKRVNGVAPEKVEATPVQTKFGTFAGGYFPIKYESQLSARAGGNDEAGFAESIKQASYVKATTRRGHTEERVKKVTEPVRLDWGVITEHVQSVIHDLTHHEMLIDVGRLLGNRKVQDAIYAHHGDVVYDQLKSAIRDVALGNSPSPGWYRSMDGLRRGVVTASLGWNLVTSLLQPFQLSNGMVRVGPKWIMKGVARWARDAASMENTATWIHERSEFMRTRGNTQLREINEIRNKVGLDRGRISGFVHDQLAKLGVDPNHMPVLADSYFYLIQKAQQVADIPTWLGQYEKSMAGGETEDRAVALADQAVIDSQGSGHIKDLSQVERGPLTKILTTFYSYQNLLLNQTVEVVKRTDVKSPKAIGRLGVDAFMLLFVPSAISFFIHGLTSGKLDDDRKLAEELIRQEIADLFGMMVGFRELSGTITGQQYEGPAGMRYVGIAGRGIQQIGQGEWDAALARALNQGFGIWLHYPATQVQRTAEGVSALWQGKTKNPAVLLFGPPK